MSDPVVPPEHPAPDRPVWGTPAAWDEHADFFRDLRGFTFTLKPYWRWSESWDHDHCLSCGCAIAEPGHRDDAITLAYGVSDKHPNGEDYEWLCPPCAQELAPRLELRLVGA